MTESMWDMRDGIAVVVLDRPPVNALGAGLRRTVYERLEAAAGHPDVRGIVLAGAGGGAFSAGADIAEFGTPEAMAFPSLPDLIALIERVSVPVVAAISGFALGGGMELALGCHARIALDSARLGLPEITLGLIPGAGGTQRLPRLIGRHAAREFIVAGKPIGAAQAQALGIVDAIVAGEVIDGAVSWLNAQLALTLNGRRDAQSGVTHDESMSLRRARDRPLPLVDEIPVPATPASVKGYALPVNAIEQCVDAAGTQPFEEGLERERMLFEMLVARPESEALRYAFFAERRASVVDAPTNRVIPRVESVVNVAATANLSTKPVSNVAVVGAGTMGIGIATCFANAGLPVKLFDTKPESLGKAMASIHSYYSQQKEKGRLLPAEADLRASRVTPVTHMADLGDADLVIEAVFESLDVKKQVFTELDACMRPGAILATNTSTLDVNVIAGFTSRPRDVVGMHFFSPAPVMRLLEIVRGNATAPGTIASVLGVAKRLGKVGVVAGVCDGFIGNRMWHEYLRQAARVVELGATPRQVDEALEQWGFAMGPFRVADLAGLDVGYLIRRHQMETRPALRWPAWLDRVSETGRVGLKGGRGIYRYEGAPRGGAVDPEIDALIAGSREEGSVSPRAFTAEEIVQWCTLALIVEGTRLLQEGIAQRGSDVDAVFLNGYGFPRHRGGPLFHADALGLEHVTTLLHDQAAHEEPEFWAPPALLLALQEAGQLKANAVSKEDEPPSVRHRLSEFSHGAPKATAMETA